MRDPRLRILTTIVLSAASFLSITGAVLTFVWWLLFTPRLKATPSPRLLIGVIVMIVITAAISELTGGLGLEYLVRMIPILLVAAWAYSDREESELLDVSVWLFGDGIGFDIGLAAEMGLQSLRTIAEDISQLRQAMRIKGMSLTISAIVPLAMNIIVNQLRRTDEVAKLLSVRGYTSGGTKNPCFSTTSYDIILTSVALFTFFTSILAI